MPEIIRKAMVADIGDGLEYTLSDETVDRYGDSIVAAGWDLRDFLRHPVALFSHDPKFIIGGWEEVRVQGGKLRARLRLAARGTSARIDELISLAEQGFMRAVSVGFAPLASEPMPDGRGIRYTRAALLECSLVAVPANPSALALSKGLNISPDTIDLVFRGEHADADDPARRRGSPGEHAVRTPIPGKQKMTLSEQIVGLEQALVAGRDELAQFTEADGFDLERSQAMAADIKARQAQLASLRDVESALSASAVPAVVKAAAPVAAPNLSRLPLNMARREKEVPLGDYVLRAHVVNALAKVTQRPRAEIMAERYGQDEMTQKVYNVVTRAASAPATTTGSGWADTLVQTSIAEFIDSLTASSVYPGLSARGVRTGFGRSGTISFPTRSAAGGSLAGAFVAQGAPIPVRQTLLAPVTLTLKKLGVITTFTREIAEHSTPDIEALLRRFISDDTSGAIDAVLVSNSAATAIAPAGLRNGVTVTTATAGGGFAALVGDVKNLTTALVTASNGNLRSPIWLMNPIQATSISLTQNAGGDFVFADQINGGNFAGYPVLLSTTVTAGMVILIDAADFVTATGDDMRFDVSDQATLHMEDTTPLPLTTGPQGTAVPATPTRSLWQTDSLGLRMIMDMNWALLRTGTVAWTTSVTW